MHHERFHVSDDLNESVNHVLKLMTLAEFVHINNGRSNELSELPFIPILGPVQKGVNCAQVGKD